MSKSLLFLIVVITVSTAWVGRAARAEEPEGTGEASTKSASTTNADEQNLEELNRQLQNPISSVWSLAFQLNNFFPNGYGSENENRSDTLVAANGDTDSTDTELDSNMPHSGRAEWRFLIAPYLWLMGINGTVGARGRTADVDIDFDDIWRNFDIGGEVHVEVWRNNLGVFVDPSFMKLKNSKDVKSINSDLTLKGDVKVKFLLLEVGGLYRVGRWPLRSKIGGTAKEKYPSLTVDVLAGGRYWYLKNEIGLRLTSQTIPVDVRRNLQEDQNWFDFIVGARIMWNPLKNPDLSLRTDIGGFDFGFSSKFAWNLVTAIGYNLPHGITPIISYRLLYDNFEDGSGSSRFVYDAWTRGP